MKRPNLCLVTEFVKQGSLADLLLNTSVRMPWLMRMRMLRSAALGIYYLHSLSPCILHRDLKPSNLLVPYPSHLISVLSHHLVCVGADTNRWMKTGM